MRPPRVLAVDIGAGHVACGLFVGGATGRLVLQQFAIEPQSSDPAHEGRWTAGLAHSLGAISSRQKLIGTCSLAVPGHLALAKFIKTPWIEPARRGNIVEFEAAENIPYPLAEVVWDHLIVADDGLDLEIMLAAAKSEAIQSLCAALDSAGFAPEQAIPAGVALYRGFRYNHPEITGDSVIVADIGARSTTLLFIEGEHFYLRTLALAGNAVTQAIAAELGIDFAQAEGLKVPVLSGRSDLPENSPARAAVRQAAAGFAQKLQAEITRSTLNHRRQSGGAQPVALYLAGGGSLIPELPVLLGEKLKLRVTRYEPLRNFDLAADARAAGAESAGAALANLAGLASQLVRKGEPEISLLPPACTAARALRRRQPRLLAAAALLVAALLPPIVYFDRVAAGTREEISQIEGQLMPLRRLQTRNADNLAKIAGMKARVAALQGAVDAKLGWIDFFGDLQARLVKVEDVWLDRLQLVRPPAAVGSSGEAGPAPSLRLAVSGRLLDVANPQSKVSPESIGRVKQLLAGFANSRFVASVENERFDNTQNGLLRFDCALVLNPKISL